MRVLIVEDETAAYENLVDILGEVSYDIQIAGNTESVTQTIHWHLRNQRLYQIRPLIAPPFAQRKFLRDIPPGLSVPLYQEKHQDSRILYHIQRQQCAKREPFRFI